MRTGARIGLAFVLGLVAAWAFGRLLRELDAVIVDGRSMAPALEPGDRLLVESWSYRRRAPRPGEIVLAGDPRAPRREIVKRVAALQDDRVALRGDAALSTDSRIFGPLPVAAIRWRVVVRYWPLSRIARLTG
ncbi:MAG TPA: nickel-type superoxide dismutase maturation protease [Candidatus Limnocylindria bacterium]|jgi:signal peptidase I